MVRYLHCRACYDGRGFGLHPEDKAMGFQERIVFLSMNPKPPARHGLTVDGVFEPMEHVICDHCSSSIDGEIAVATTHWRAEQDEPRDWETMYGTTLPYPVVQMVDTLTKQ